MSDDAGATPSKSKKHGHTRAEIEATVADIEAQVRATNDKINARSGRNLSMAVLVGVALGLTLLFSLIFVKELFMLFAAGLVAFTAFELASALRFAGRDVPRIPILIVAVAIVPVAFYWGAPGHWLGLIGGVVFVSVWRLFEAIVPSRRPENLRELGRDLAAGGFVLAYVVFLGSFAVLLTAQENGQWWTLAFLLVVISIDTGAYVTGLNFGKHKMAPIISPKKTWEGFAGSVAAALTAGILLAIFMLHVEWWVGIVLGLTMVVTATFGDLGESLIKRDLGIKDISTWLPGHGGFLDRLDSILPSAAAAYGLYLIFG